MSDEDEFDISELEFGGGGSDDSDDEESAEEVKAEEADSSDGGGGLELDGLEVDGDDSSEAEEPAAGLELGGDDDAGGLELGGDDDAPGLELGGDDDAPGLELGGADTGDVTLEAAEEPGLDLGDDSPGLELGGDDDAPGLELGGADSDDVTLEAAEEPGLDLGDDSPGLELGGDDDAPGLELGGGDSDEVTLDAAEEAGLDLGGDSPGLELGGEDDAPGLETAEEPALDLGDDSPDLDLGGDDSTADDLVLGGEEVSVEVNEEIDELSTDVAAVEAAASMEEDKGEATQAYEAKLAEIDAMMEDEVSPTSATEDSTGDIAVPEELSASANESAAQNDGEFTSTQLDAMIATQDDTPAELPEMPTMVKEIEQPAEPMQEMPIPKATPANNDDHNTHVRNQLAEISEMMDTGSPAEDNGDATVIAQAPIPEAIQEMPVPTPQATAAAPQESKEKIEEQKILMEHHSDELLRLQGIISELRDDRANLLDRIDEFEEKVSKAKQNNLSEKAELEEKKIELSLVKKNFNKRIDEYQSRLEVSEEKKEVLLERNKKLQKQLDDLKGELHRGIQKIGNREKELENKLELLRSDAEVQISNRDTKILDLKRKIDTLEFDLKHVSSNEQKTKMMKIENEEKMNKVMNTLRNAISILEDDGNIEHKLQVLKKSIDV